THVINSQLIHIMIIMPTSEQRYHNISFLHNIGVLVLLNWCIKITNLKEMIQRLTQKRKSLFHSLILVTETTLLPLYGGTIRLSLSLEEPEKCYMGTATCIQT
ncbi:hypothetical protein ACJX0J_039368, partial [Zea mays]